MKHTLKNRAQQSVKQQIRNTIYCKNKKMQNMSQMQDGNRHKLCFPQTKKRCRDANLFYYICLVILFSKAK